MKKSSSFLIVSLLLCLSLFPSRIGESCVHIPSPFVGYSIIHPGISKTPTSKPFSFTYTYSNWNWDKKVYVTNKNIEEWHQYFCGKASIEDLNFLIYKSNFDHLDVLGRLQEDKNIAIPDTLQHTSLVEVFRSFKFPHFIEYLSFAKKVEIELDFYHGWEKRIPNESNLVKLKKEAIKNYESIDDDFLKLRYAYHMLRLDFWHSDQMEVTFEKYVKPLEEVKSVIQNRCLERVGGYLQRSKNLEKQVYGNVLLAKSLIGNLERSQEVYLSFNITNDEEWELSLARCETNEEKAMLYYLRGLELNSIALEDMRVMYELYPNALALENLMTREIQKIELKLLSRKIKKGKRWVDYSDENYGLSRPLALNYIHKIKPFVKRVVKENKSFNPAFWMMIDGYLEYLTKNNRKAQTILAKAKAQVTHDSMLADQIELFEFVTLLSLMNTVDDSLEKRFMEIIKHNKAYIAQPKDECDFFMEKMASLYYQKGDATKAHLCNHSIYGLKFYPNVDVAKGVLELFDKKGKNDFEYFLLNDDDIKTREELVDLWGTALLGEARNKEALHVFKQIPSFGKIFKNPFKIFTNDQTEDNKLLNGKNPTKFGIVEHLVALENKLSRNPNHPEVHLQLGIYEFNTSFFGEMWDVKDYFISQSSYYPLKDYYGFRWVHEFGGSGTGNKEFMNLSKARYHLKKVLENTNDKELIAQVNFMFWKLEQVNNRLQDYKDKKDQKAKRHFYKSHFVKNSKQTDFFQKVIKECASFSMY